MFCACPTEPLLGASSSRRGLKRLSWFSRSRDRKTDRKVVFRHPADFDATLVTENWFVVSVVMIHPYRTQAGVSSVDVVERWFRITRLRGEDGKKMFGRNMDVISSVWESFANLLEGQEST